MKKHLICISEDGTSAEFKEDLTAGLFMDFNSFNAWNVSGVFDERNSYGVDGSQIYSKALSPRPVKFTARLLSYNLGSTLKPIWQVDNEVTAKLNRVFSPRSTIKMVYFDGVRRWQLDCISNSLPVRSEWDGLTREFTFDLTAPCPFWKSDEAMSVDIGLSEVTATLPTSLSTVTGTILSDSATIYNPSSYDVYPIVRFHPCLSPAILINSATNKYIGLNTAVSEGFYVDVDTDPRNLTVTLYDQTGDVKENVTYWLAPSSAVDFQLIPGVNDLIVKNMVAGIYPVATVLFHEVML